jgi:hypothetical protein
VYFTQSFAHLAQTLSEFIKAVTSLPSDMTLISLPSGPLLKTVCLAAQKQLTGAWLSLVSMLVIQLDPPSLLPPRFKTTNEEAQMVVSQILPGLLRDSLIFLSRQGVMEDVGHCTSPTARTLTVDLEPRHSPRILFLFGVGERRITLTIFSFSFWMQFANHFVASFYHLSPELFSSLMQCAIASLGLQERYSMVAGCSFIVS